jgi:glycosyltransferase involved in cell wall biosynthesis
LITYHVGKDVSFANVRIYRVWKIPFIKHVRIGPSRAKILLDVLVFLKAILLLLRTRYDVIHSHEEAAFFGLFLAWFFRLPHLYDMHSILSRQLTNFDFGNQPLFVKLFSFLENKVLKSCAAVITVGSDLENYVRSVDDKIPVTMIENIALHAYQMQVSVEEATQLGAKLNLEGSLPVVYTGTFERYQGLDLALDCIQLVAKKYPQVMFIFVGSKNRQKYEWAEKAEKKGVADNTLFLDVVTPEEAIVFLAYASVLISPRLEGLSTPLKIYSYLYSGKPIVATHIAAHTQVLNPEIALLVAPTKEAFAAGIINILDDKENAHQFALEKFSKQNYLEKVENIYQLIVPRVKETKLAVPQEN